MQSILLQSKTMTFPKQKDWFEITRSYMVHDENSIKGFFGDYMFLSNFYISKFSINFKDENIEFDNVESFYQGFKSGEIEDLKRFSKMSPKLAKSEGRKLKLLPNWDRIKSHVMFCACYEKFIQNNELKLKLLATMDKYLEETNHWNDTYWGVQYNSNKGFNMLGQTLMSIRSIVRD